MDDTGATLVVATGVSEKYLRREEIRFTGKQLEAPIEGDSDALMTEWSKKLGLTFSNDDILPDNVVSSADVVRPIAGGK